MTGAPVPPGCDSVVMHERTRSENGSVVIEQTAVRPGQNLLRRGTEMQAGEIVLSRGSLLHPAHLGVLASVGRTQAQVIPRPRVSIVPTGDELVEPGETPGPGQIRNSNAVLLRALASESGAIASTLRIAPTNPTSSPGSSPSRSRPTSSSSPAACPPASAIWSLMLFSRSASERCFIRSS